MEKTVTIRQTFEVTAPDEAAYDATLAQAPSGLTVTEDRANLKFTLENTIEQIVIINAN